MEAILRHDALRQVRDAMAGPGGEHADRVVTRLIDYGYCRREVLEMVQAVYDHLQGPSDYLTPGGGASTAARCRWLGASTIGTSGSGRRAATAAATGEVR